MTPLSKKAPAFQWYPKDCDTDEDVRSMNDQEFGFYMRCLNHSWLNDGLPGDLSEVARTLHKTKNYVEKIWKRVGKKFVISDGRFVNPKQEEQRITVREFIDSRRSAANVRWKPAKLQSKTDARALHVDCSPIKQIGDAEGEVVSLKHSEVWIPKQAAVRPPMVPMSNRFDEFWAFPGISWKTLRRDLAAGFWAHEVTIDNEAALFDCLADYALSSEVASGKLMNPENWLSQCAACKFTARWPKMRDANGSRSKQQQMADLYDRS